ncbi:MAG TPA: hypothetical protein VFJ98_04425 [Mycobacteriales bacterium]|nr:hypothetical protein [Mycobacteriales bacterium]
MVVTRPSLDSPTIDGDHREEDGVKQLQIKRPRPAPAPAPIDLRTPSGRPLPF